nr:unnamed protein product [Callosobruchus chinensis]
MVETFKRDSSFTCGAQYLSSLSVFVEINKEPPDKPAENEISIPVPEIGDDKHPDKDQIKKQGATKRTSENFDEILTIKREEAEETKHEDNVCPNGDRKEEVQDEELKHKGFSLQRAWCCLRGRRTS